MTHWMLGALAALSLVSAAGAAEPVPGWTVEGADREGDVKSAPYLGRDALWLKAGTHAVRKGVTFTDGTIEFDLSPMPEADFIAITFRRQSFSQHENIYFRIRRSGDFMSLQYAPRLGSSSWQLYPEFLAVAEWPHGAWTHVRVEVSGSHLEVFVGEAEKPALVVERLRHGSTAGEVAVWSRVNQKPQVWSAAISNFQVRPAASKGAFAAARPPPGEFISRWRVSAPFPSTEAAPAGVAWQVLSAEESGLVNLSRAFGQQVGKTLTAVAKATIVSDRDRMVRLDVGYSDQVEVSLNGQTIYGAVNGFNSRYPGYTGFVDTRYEHAWLPLKAGRNELSFAVTDDQAFGWGFAARLDSLEGLRVEP